MAAFKLSDTRELTLPLRRAFQSLKVYVDQKKATPVLTTTERDDLTPEAGWVIFNSTTSKHQGYDGTTWQNLY